MNYLVELLTTACEQLFHLTVEPSVVRPEAQFGDAATNVALVLAKQLQRQPRAVAEEIAAYLKDDPHNQIAKVSVAGPGFINIQLTDRALWEAAQRQPRPLYAKQTVLLEYSCPNAFKELHTGHLYQTIVGDTLGILSEAGGATVFRANFNGDVGLHVAKAMWGIVNQLDGINPDKLADVPSNHQARWLGKAYVAGAQAFEANPKTASEITNLNKQIYQIIAEDDHDSALAKIYWECRAWSFDYFARFYRDLGVAAFDKYYPESSTTPRGLETVKQHTGSVFQESQGAVIFAGEAAGAHTRVFITSQGLPTYETKDLGVILSEHDDFKYDRRIVLTGNDQAEYMKVVFAALAEIDSNLAAKQTNFVHGTIRFGDGKKMSSRLGNVTPATAVLSAIAQAVEAPNETLRKQIATGALRYAFLRHRLGGDIAFDVNESVSLAGNSGPYLQYAYARARSILAKGSAGKLEPSFQAGERVLVRKLGEFAGCVEQAMTEFSPHLICNYLYELAQTFNRFYEQNRVIGDERQAVRLVLVDHYANTLHHGLSLLGIPAPDRF